MTFLAEQGVLALGSRFKALSDRFYDIADAIYRELGIGLQARWFPLVHLLHAQGPLSVTEIAERIGQTHSAVSQLAAKLTAGGWLEAMGDARDRRRRTLALTAQAEAAVKAAQPAWQAIRAEMEQRLAAQGGGLMHALAALEENLAERPLAADVLARCRSQAGAQVRVVPFAPALREHFYRLNAEWLSKYYRIEPIDHAVLSEPEQHILGPGGTILFALLGDEVVGTCALLQEAPGVYELTKMAVTERHRGLGIGRRLMDGMIAEYKRLGGHTLFLESHSALRPALRLYETVGFELQPGVKPGSHYQRADVYMIYREHDLSRARRDGRRAG
ncbi:bifunctional helix-turn-helix transcriptional regulator/GNAT family N-acetyltransferase [Luteimonas aquatica]|uniref:bifunctional helix-turn-helix transcriptional regulator/GNAT family N-acetyltransferase n=1 Tax=Luteimonas aquatica TaxID=450364 RepID=UPI001F575E9C|nr:bifunctional helix-turn-helix transcriptional regulator/GNAT family N-acetyltransferase [Luteimonas aquatica]